MDSIDRRLIVLLQADARLSLQELGHAVGLSPPAVHQRIRKLEAGAVVQGYFARVSPALVGRSVLAYLRVSLPPSADVAHFVDRWKSSGDYLECHWMGGEGEFLLKLRLSRLESLREHLDALRRAGCRARADIALQTLFERWALPPT